MRISKVKWTRDLEILLTSVGVTVTGASPYRAAVLAKNKFQSLQMLMIDEHTDDSSEQLLQGQKSDSYSIIKAVNVKNVQPKTTPLLEPEENKTLVEKNWVFGKGEF